MATYEISRDGIDDLALPTSLGYVLEEVLDGPDGMDIETEINERVSAQIDAHGGIDQDGTWPGEWSAIGIVKSVLDSHSLGNSPLAKVARAARERAVADAHLVAAMGEAKAGGMSLRDIADVAAMYGTKVTHTTVKSWLDNASEIEGEALASYIPTVLTVRIEDQREDGDGFTVPALITHASGQELERWASEAVTEDESEWDRIIDAELDEYGWARVGSTVSDGTEARVYVIPRES